MSKHLLVVDANVPAFTTIRNAKRRGYCVSFIRSDYKLYSETDEVIRTIYDADNVLSIGNPMNGAELTAAMRAIHLYRPVDGVITQLEPCVDVVARACAELGLRFTDAQAVANARDKARARKIIEGAGLRSARHAVVFSQDEARAAAAEIGGPVILKPRTGFDSLLAYPAATPDAAAAAAGRILREIAGTPRQIQEQLGRGVLVEEHLVGELVSAEIGRADGRFHRFMLSGRPRSVENECIEMGASMPADLSAEQTEACFRYAEQVAEALGLDIGTFHIEMIVTAGGPVLVEANPRLMGGVMPGLYKNLTGDDISEHLIDIHLGLPVSRQSSSASGFIVSRKLMPREAGRLAPRVDLDWVAEAPELIQFDGYRLQPGSPVDRLGILARYQVRADSLAAANAVADRLLDRFERSVGIPLIR